MKKSFIYDLLKISKAILLVVVLFLLAESYILGLTVVSGESMMNTIKNNDRILINRIPYLLGNPVRGDVVVFSPPIDGRNDELFIKRIVAIPGDYFEILNNKLYLNGITINEDYINNKESNRKEFKFIKGKVPKGYVYVLGDNRSNSNDSRVFGLVPIESIKGKALTKIWPFQGMKSLAVHYDDISIE